MKTLEQKIRQVVADYFEDDEADNPETLVKTIMNEIGEHNLREQYEKSNPPN